MKIYVNLQNIERNARAVKASAGCELCAVVKADAYGHGAERVTECLQGVADCYAVATYSEAKRLVGRTDRDILILGADETQGENRIIPTAVSVADYERKRRYERINLALDTGMNRFGVTENELNKLTKNGNIFSVFSHIRASQALQEQTEKFDRMCDFLNISCKKHLYASNFVQSKRQYDMVRVGLALYGYGKGLKPAMTVKARIERIAWVRAGDCVGYGNNRLERDTKIATVNMGYRDGFARLRDGQTRLVSVGGALCPIVGQVCMDSCMVDVSETIAREGDEVEVLGEALSGERLAEQMGTIVYEILTCFRHREDIIYQNG